MNKITFSIIIIVVGTIFLIVLNYLNLLEKSAKFMLIPFLIFYFLRQFSEKKIQKIRLYI
jgi:hypothetical protein